MSLAEQLELQYGNLTASLTANIAKAQRSSSDERRAIVNNAEQQVRDIDDLLEQIELVVHDEKDELERKRLTTTIASFKADARKLENELSKIRREVHDSMDRMELLGDEDFDPESQHSQLISNTERLEKSNRQLYDAYDVSLSTIDIGAQTLRDLESQRHVIKKARNRVRETNEDIYQSSRSLTSMLNRLMRDRVAVVAVSVLFFFVICLFIYWAVRKA
ncbi:V-SNARE C and V-SNARE domain containing protein [Trichuris trichiura]|uniref:V-SNARE C and V-SNARE domain containing protein n=1 Tax=Trichuris trichiura TaxID=36087 RepID=A0A077Z245_TRITR|nr:V-SNARE C and V-SNARE domain containing protein [Trichuris trichiura]